MKYLKFFAVGTFFGIVLSKSEAISWYRIYEMFKFQSFHMYGIIGSAVVIGMIIMYFFKHNYIKDYKGNPICVQPKKGGNYRNILGGIIFGLGWALAGACPGPMFVLIGKGIFSIIIAIVGSLLGTFLYGVIKNKIPH